MSAPANIRNLVTESDMRNSTGRVVDYLSDGSVIAVVKDQIDKFYVYRSTNRQSWTLVKTITTTHSRGAPFCHSVVVDASDNIHIAWASNNANQIRYVKLTHSAGPSWSTGSEQVADSGYGGGSLGALDIDVLASGAIVVAHTHITSGNVVRWRYACRDTGGTWTANSATTIAGNKVGSCIAICADTTGAVSNLQKFALVVGGGNGSPVDLYVVEVNIANGTHSSRVQIDAAAFGNHTGPHKKAMLFENGPAEWVLVGLVGGGGNTVAYAATVGLTAYVLGPTSQTAVFASAYSQIGDRAIGMAKLGTGADAGLAYVAFREEDGLGGADIVYGMVARVGASAITWNPRYQWFRAKTLRGMGAGGHNHHAVNEADVAIARGGASGFITHAGIYDPPTTGAAVLSPTSTSVPAALLPGASRTLVSGIPGLFGPKVYGQWTIASDSGFTTDVLTVTEPPTHRVNGGTLTEPIAAINALPQGTWYVRGRTIDEFDRASAWSATSEIVIAHAPAAVAVTPAGSSDYAATVTFAWNFSDTYAADTQSAYQIVVERDDGTSVEDTGWVTSTTSSADLAIDVGETAYPLRWKVRVKDAEGVEGEYSPLVDFSLQTPPTVAITSPLTGSSLTENWVVVEWDYADGDGGAQASYRIVVIDEETDEVVFTEHVASSSPEASVSPTTTPGGASPPPPPPIITPSGGYRPEDTRPPAGYGGFMVHGQSYTFIVTVTDESGRTATDTETGVLADWTPPPQPPLVVTPSDGGYNRLAWDSDLAAMAFVSVDEPATTPHQAAFATITNLDVRIDYDGGDWTAGGTLAADTDGTGTSGWRLDYFWFGFGGYFAFNAKWWDGTSWKTRQFEVDPPLPEGRHDIRATIDGATGTFSVYVDGVLWGSATYGASHPIAFASSHDLQLGGRAGTYYGVELMDDIDGDLLIGPTIGNALWATTGDSYFEVTFHSWRAHRLDEDGNWVLIATETGIEDDYTFDDYLAPSGVAVTYAVTQLVYDPVSGSYVESNFTDEDVTVPAGASADYWLVTADQSTVAKVRHVTDDPFAEEYEEAEIVLAGRGRKVERGDRLGYRGALTATLRDVAGATGRAQRLELEALRSANTACYLKNPFGDVWLVNLGEMTFTRTPGVGATEYDVATIPYMEIA